MKRHQSDVQPRAVLRVGRLRFLFGLVLLCLAIMILRLIYVQIIRGDYYAQLARRQQMETVTIAPQRGRIVDRGGQELAVDLPHFYSVKVYPAMLKQSALLCQELAAITGRPAWHYLRRLQSHTLPHYLEWRLTPDQKERLEKDQIEGIVLEQTKGRFYPYNGATAQLLGYTDVDGRGISGLEIYCDSVLQGSHGWETHLRTATRRSFWDPFRHSISPKNGGTVRLSIDIVAQEMLYQELDAAICSTRSEWVGGLLMDPRSGEILSLVSVPTYDPLRPELGDQANHKVRPLTDMIEPGSVFKIVAATAALDQNAVQPSDLFNCEGGRYAIGSRILRDAHPYGTLSFEDVLVHSSNIGTAKVAERIGSRELYRYAVRYGFGSLTGVEFPGEASGVLRPYDQWRDIGRANVAIGQGVSVTMLQVALAYSAIANDGVLMEPRMILGWTDADGTYHPNLPQEVRRVMEPETAWTLRQILTQVVVRGTGKAATLDSLDVAGKTGTAQIPNLESGGYYQDRYVASFVGFMPAFDADRLLVICAYNPQGAHYGAQIAAPIFRRVLQRLMPADAVRTAWKEAHAEFVEVPTRVRDAGPAAGNNFALTSAKGVPLLNIAKAAPSSVAFRAEGMDVVPDVRGLTLRRALSLLSERGIQGIPIGSGRVISQSQAAGSPVIKNSTCHLTLGLEAVPDTLGTDSLGSGKRPAGTE